MSMCTRCTEFADWAVFATYDLDLADNAHPPLARYPMPMALACSVHLTAVLIADSTAQNSTNQWVVRSL